MKEIIKILKNYRLDKKLFFGLTFFSIVSWVLILINPKIFEQLIFVLENDLEKQQLIFWWIIWWVLLIFINIFWYLNDIFEVKIWETIYCKRSLIIREKLLKKNYKDLLDEWTWKIISRVTRWVEAEAEIFLAIFQILTTSIFRMLVVIIVFLIYFPSLLLIVLVLTLILFLFNFLFTKKINEYSKKENDLYEAWDRILVRIIWEHLSIKMFNKSDLELNKSRNVLSWIPVLAWKKVWYQALINIVLYTWIRTLELASYIYIWFLVLEWTESISTLTMIMSYLWIMRYPMEKAANELNRIIKNFQAYKKLDDFVEKENDIKDWENQYNYHKWNIEFKNLSFSYWNWKNIFKNLNLDFLAWKKNALVWHSWSWKSTIVKLILRLYDFDNWDILVDNQSLKELKIDSLYKHIWYLAQDASVFDWTIRENLEYAFNVWEKYDDIILWKALNKARIDTMIKTLKDWLDTEVWERWIKLSGWEKQRLAIARIFLKNPKIIILDEPTSALDSISEMEITKTLNELMKWKTSIIIAHRLQTVMNSDKIFIIENWEIAWVWKHDDLILNNSIYKKLVDLQNWRIIE